MGDRAVIAMSDKNDAIGIYLHWDAERPRVEAFLEAAKKLGVRLGDPDYSMARLTQIIANYIGGTTGIGIGTLKNLDCDNGNNGLYIINDQLEIVCRKFYKGKERTGENHEELVAEVMSPSAAFFKDRVLK